MKVNRGTFFIILAIVLLIVYTSVFGLFGIKGVGDIRFGIDIRGGVEAVFEPKNHESEPTAEELASARTIIETRLDNSNILDREVTVDKQNGNILVRFPWKSPLRGFPVWEGCFGKRACIFTPWAALCGTRFSLFPRRTSIYAPAPRGCRHLPECGVRHARESAAWYGIH